MRALIAATMLLVSTQPAASEEPGELSTGEAISFCMRWIDGENLQTLPSGWRREWEGSDTVYSFVRDVSTVDHPNGASRIYARVDPGAGLERRSCTTTWISATGPIAVADVQAPLEGLGYVTQPPTVSEVDVRGEWARLRERDIIQVSFASTRLDYQQASLRGVIEQLGFPNAQPHPSLVWTSTIIVQSLRLQNARIVPDP